MSILHFYFILTINQQLLTLFCESLHTRFTFSPNTRMLGARSTAYQTFSLCASENRVGKDIINYYRIRLVCVCVSAPLPYATTNEKKWVPHSFPRRSSLTLCIRFVDHSCRTSYARTNVWMLRIFGHRINLCRNSTYSHVNEREWSEEKCQFLIYELRTWIWVNKRGRSGKRMKWRIFFFEETIN